MALNFLCSTRDWTCFRYVVSQTWKNKDFLSLLLFSLNTYQEDTKAHKYLSTFFYVSSKKVLKLAVNELWRGRKDKKGQGRVRKGKGGEEGMVRKERQEG